MTAGPVFTRADDGVELALFRAAPEWRRSAPPVLPVHGTFSNRTRFLGTRGQGLAHELARRGDWLESRFA